MLFHFEHRSQPVLRQSVFVRRLTTSFGIGSALIALSLMVGMAGYHFIEGLSIVDSFENAAMILSGMGPLWHPETTAGKLFAGAYALYSGLAVIAIAGFMLAPVVHRFLHVLHAEDRRPREE